MNHFMRLTASAAALATLAAAPAAASIHSDALSKCLVAKSSAEDRILLIQWIFGAMSAHPAVKGLAEVSEARRKALAGDAARLFGRLILDDCRAETIAAVRYDGSGALQTSFGVFGQVAMADLMAHPNVGREMEAMADRLDGQRLEALMREAGGPTPPK